MKNFSWLALALLLVIAVVVYVGVNLNTRYVAFNQEVFVDVPKGTSARQIAAMLQNAGVIRTFLDLRGGPSPSPGRRAAGW